MRATVACTSESVGGHVNRLLLVCGTIAAVGVSRTAAAQSLGAVAGLVRDSAGKPVAGVTIAVVGSTVYHTASDDSGAYRVSGLPAGVAQLFARRLGFAPETVSVSIAANATAKVDFRLTASATQLQTSVVEADPKLSKMAPFNRRRARGVGAFLTRADIEKQPTTTLSELLRYLPGVGVQQKPAGEPQPIRMQRSASSSMQSTCVVQLYVDGHPYPNGNVDDFSPNVVEGVEVYRSASEVPAEFRTRDASCGVISIWTRDPDAARKRPS